MILIKKTKNYPLLITWRILILILLFTFIDSSLYAQETDSLLLSPDSIRISGDTLRISGDTLRIASDTLKMSGDTMRIASDTLKMSGDSLRISGTDTLRVNIPGITDHSPMKAIMYALVLPGLGQAYNRKFYKIPIVYGALGSAGYAIHFNNTNYKEASFNYATDPSDLNERYLRAWRRNLELSYIGLVAVYALQVIDAYVDAELYNWDVSKELSIRLQPSIRPIMLAGSNTVSIYGISCSLRLKH